MSQFQPVRSGNLTSVGEGLDPIFEANLAHMLSGLPDEYEKTDLVPVDMVERDGQVIVLADLPGCELRDLTISVSGRILTVGGITRHEETARAGRIYFRERARGCVQRSIVLPAGVDTAHYQVKFRNGLLKVQFRKRQH